MPVAASPFRLEAQTANTTATTAFPRYEQAAAVSLTGPGWSVVPSYSFGSLDNIPAGVSAASATDAWAVGAYYPSSSNVLATLAEHFGGTCWTAYPLPNLGIEENVLLAVSMPSAAWAVGCYVSGKFQQQTLIEHFDGSVWSVVPSPSPGALQNILCGVAAISVSDAWAVAADQDADGVSHTLTEHWDGSAWSVGKAVDAGLNGNQFYAVKAIASNSIYAVGQQAGTEFHDQGLIEHWDGTAWSIVSSPFDSSSTALPLGFYAHRLITDRGGPSGDRHRTLHDLRGCWRVRPAVDRPHAELRHQ